MHFGHFESFLTHFRHILRHFSDIEREVELLLIPLGPWDPQGSPRLIQPHSTAHQCPLEYGISLVGSVGPFWSNSVKQNISVAAIGMQASEENWPVSHRGELRGHLEGILSTNRASLIKIHPPDDL